MTDELRDRHDIAQVIVRYATSVDQRDLERYATCFTDDVTVTGFSGGAFTDRSTYVAWVGQALAKYAATHHQISNSVIELRPGVDGEPDRAHMRSHVQATHVLADDHDVLVILWAVYDDDLVRTPDGWRITRHHLDRLIAPRRIQAPPA